MGNKYKNNFKKQQIDSTYSPSGKKEDLDRKIEDLNLSKHCYDALVAGGVTIVRQLCMYQMSKMYRIQNIGKKDCFEIQAALKKYNLCFRPEDATKPDNKNTNKQQNQPNKQNKQNQVNQQKPGKNDNIQQIKNNLNFSIFDDHRLVQFIDGKREREVFKWEDTAPERREVFKFCRNGKWGYKNQKGAVVIQPAFDEAFQFREGFACVEKNGKLGYINANGDLVIEFQFEAASSYYEGLACVSIGDQTWFIDYDGNKKFEQTFQKATPFSNGKALIKSDDKWGVLALDGSIYWR